MYYQGKSCAAENRTDEETTVADLRSDTVTKPTLEMREAMYRAEVGDDVYEEDPTVKKLENKAAEMLGMEAALFVPTGTMGNLIAIMNHCDTRACEAYCGELSHTFLHEQGGAAQLGGVTLSPLPNNADGTFSLETLRSKLRRDRLHEPISRLILVENTMNGKVLSEAWLKAVVAFARKHSLKLHMDGARLWNAVTASGRTAKHIVEGFDSVTFCLSKGLGSPVGSILCGNKEFIARARRIRKVLGGGTRQVGVLAAAGLVSLEKVIPILKYDHARAKKLAVSINDTGSKIFTADLSLVHTNMVFVNVKSSESLCAMDFATRLRNVQSDDSDDKCAVVKSLALTDTLVRFVLHYDITDELLDLAIRKINYVIRKIDPDLQDTC